MNLEKINYIKQDAIAWITLNDPELRNPITGNTALELNYCLEDCADDESIRAVVIRGEGKSFSAGGNLQIMKQRLDTGGSNTRPGIRRLGGVFNTIRTMDKPVIAAMHGSAAGARLSLALACDFRIAATGCKFTMAFANIGFIADMGSVHSLVKNLGVSRTTDLLFTGRLFTAEEAQSWGLIHQVVAIEELAQATETFARRMADGPTIAYGYLKNMINQIAYRDIQLTMNSELEYQYLCAKTQDHREGVYAFFEKRKPSFMGK